MCHLSQSTASRRFAGTPSGTFELLGRIQNNQYTLHEHVSLPCSVGGRRPVRPTQVGTTFPVHLEFDFSPEAFLHLSKSKEAALNLQPQHIKSWAQTMTNRAANMLRHIAQAKLKCPNVPWYRNLPWEAGPPASHAAASAIGDAAFTYGWDVELRQAWRSTGRGKKAAKEAAVRIEIDPGSGPDSPVTAVWADGHRHPVTEITAQEHQAMIQNSASSRATKDMWDGEHSVTQTSAKRFSHVLHLGTRSFT